MPFFDFPLDKLKTYKGSTEKPADFDRFWSRTLKDHASHDPAPVLTRLEDDFYVNVHAWDVTFAGFDGHPIKGWYTRPASAAGKKIPCVIVYHGYGGGRQFPFDLTSNWPTLLGMASFTMDTRGQNGGNTGDPAGNPGPYTSGYMTQGIQSPEHYFYRRVYTDAVLAIRAAATLDDVDRKRIAITGGSQGGGITLAAAALSDHPLKLAMADVPFLCDFPRATSIIETMPYGEIAHYLTVHRNSVDQVFKTLAYFDGVNMASRIKARTLISVGLMDTICPPSTVYAAYNNIKAKKDIKVYPYNKHEGGGLQHAQERMKYTIKYL